MFKQVSSTQDTAKRFVHRNEELAVIALSQKRGRGRQHRQWYSPLGGLYLSLVLFPRVRHTSIPFVAALTIIRVLEDFGFTRLSILWPNDVLINRRKVCGIICEQYKKAIICGIGLNVNIDKFGQDLEQATSLRLESGKDFQIDDILEQVMHWFNVLYEELQGEGLKVKEVLNYLSGLGDSAEVHTPKEVVKGTVYDIDDDWALLLRDDAGVIKKFYYGDVRRLVW
jgi:BirA family biotin operon repressor/biotin-[acetyl-CoA-carboxylase] ligase